MGFSAEKRRGEFPCGISPLLSDFSKIWFGFQITPFVTPESFGACKPCGSLPPHSSFVPLVVRAFSVSSKAPSCPVASREPLPVLLMALVYSLLLEDFSSVDLKHTRDLSDCKRVW